MATTEKWAKLFKSRHQYADSVPVQLGDAKDAAFNWNGSVLQLLPVTDDTGAFNIGDGTTDFDFKWFAGTANKWVRFDVADAVLYTEDVDLQIGDNDIINFGDGNDVAFSWDATNLNIVPATDNTGQILIGNGTKDIDVKIFMNTTSEFVLFDVNVPTVDFGSDGKGVDLRLFGETGSALCQWDMSNDQLVLTGNASINYYVGGVPSNHTPISVGRFVASAASGGGYAVTSTNSAGLRVYAEETADLTSAATVRAILGRFLVTGAITSNAECFGVVGQLVAKAATIQHDNAGVMGTFEAQTTAVTISGTGGDHVVAAVMGRVGVTVTATTVNTDGILAGVAAMSNITSGYVTVNGSGVLAAFYAGQFSSKQDWNVAFHNAVSSATKAADLNGVANGLYVTATALTADSGRIGKFVGTVATPNHGDGYGAFEVDVTMSGAIAGTSAAFSSWVNLAAAAVPGGNMICAQNNGIYLPNPITATSAKMVIGMRMHYVADDGAAPGSLFLFSTNIYSNVLTALFDVNALVDMGGSTGAATTNGYKIPLFKDASANKVWYVNVYDG